MRTAEQCRTHHQKFALAAKGENINDIIMCVKEKIQEQEKRAKEAEEFMPTSIGDGKTDAQIQDEGWQRIGQTD